MSYHIPKLFKCLSGHGANVTDVTFCQSLESNSIISVADDGLLIRHNYPYGAITTVIRNERVGDVFNKACDISKDESFGIVAGFDTTAKLYDLKRMAIASPKTKP